MVPAAAKSQRTCLRWSRSLDDHGAVKLKIDDLDKQPTFARCGRLDSAIWNSGYLLRAPIKLLDALSIYEGPFLIREWDLGLLGLGCGKIHRQTYRSQWIKSTFYDSKLHGHVVNLMKNITAYYECDQGSVCCQTCCIAKLVGFQFQLTQN